MLKDSSYALVQVGFRTQLYLLDEARRKRVVMDDGEEDEELDHTDIIAPYDAFDDDVMGADDEEDAAAAEDMAADDALGDAIRDAQRECESEKEKAKFKRMLKDHRKLLYPTAEDGLKKLGTTLKLLQ